MSSTDNESDSDVTGDKPNEPEHDTAKAGNQGAPETSPVTGDVTFTSNPSSNPSSHEASPLAVAGGSKPKQKRKPRAKRELTQKELDQRRKAAKARAKTLTKEHQIKSGKALARKKGSQYMQEMGAKGGEIARARHPNLPERAGEANWERIKRSRAEKESQDEQARPPEHGASSDRDAPDIKPKPASNEANDN